MDGQGTRKPSLQARAAYLRRLQSRRRTANVKRTPNGPLAPSMTHARDALEVAWDATQEVVPDDGPRVADMMTRASDYRQRSVPVRDREGIARPYLSTYAREATRYGLHTRTRLTGQGRKVYARTDQWARDRSLEVGIAKVWDMVVARRSLYVRAASVQGIGNGTEPMSWDELHNPEAMVLRRALRAHAEHINVKEAIWRSVDDSGRRVEWTTVDGIRVGGYRLLPT